MMISVVTVTYNCKTIVEGTILSVIAQDYPELEYIIIDGDSSDGTKDILEVYRKDIDILISEKDDGIYDAMNKGLNLAHGEWIFFMNAGDVFYNDSVLSQMDLDKIDDDNVCAVFGDFVFKTKIGLHRIVCNEPFYVKKDLVGSPSMGFHHQSVFVRTEYAKQLKFDTSYQLCADYDMIYRMYKKGYSFQHREVFVSVVEGRAGASVGNPICQLKEHYKLLGLSDKKTAQIRLFLFSVRIKISKFIKIVLSIIR